MKQTRPDVAPPHPFFHAMVVMGGTVALGCGGVTTGSRQEGAPGASGTGGTGGTGTVGSGGSTAFFGGTGGAFFMGSTGGANPTTPFATGGTFSTGGIGGASAGGTTSLGGTTGLGGGASAGGAPSPADGGMATCPPAQWTCTQTPACSSMTTDWVLPMDGCRCDTARPKTAADCVPGQILICRAGVAPGAPTVTVPFECACISADVGCQACGQIYGPSVGGGYSCRTPASDGGAPDVLCGCAFVYLR